LLLALFVYLVGDIEKIVTTILVGGIILGVIIELFFYIERTNRKLTRFLESVRYSDFISGFSSDNELGKSFKDLNKAFNEVLEAFRRARSEKEEHWQYLNTVVQQVGTGLLSFDEEGNVELINTTAKKYLRAPQIHNIAEIKKSSDALYKLLIDIEPGASTLFQLDFKTNLAIYATELVLRKNAFKLITMQNIQPELQQKEIESWQNLTRVLRHEIMNSITPIASLTSTMKDILVEDLDQKNGVFEIGTEAVDDLQDGLNTIESRSQGLIRFIDAYRDYTSIPAPKVKTIVLADLIDHITNLLKIEIRKSSVNFDWEVQPPDLTISVDEELMEQVLINMLKNAIEAVDENDNPMVRLRGSLDPEDHVIITLYDNGQGILPEAQEKIFIPFYTTKKTGSGIGLALSRQIMQLHNGSLSVDSVPDEYTEFTLKF
jgi:nitrogen fixation/metabolism regulation signal transduction histidine kinase